MLLPRSLRVVQVKADVVRFEEGLLGPCLVRLLVVVVLLWGASRRRQ